MITAGITPVRIDVTDQTAVDGALAAIEGDLAGLVNCAGIIQRGGAEFQIDAFRQTLEVNLVGTMQMCLAVKPRLAAGAAIVDMASMLSTFGSAAVPGYSASKGGVVQLTKNLAAAWAADEVWGSATARSGANAKAVAGVRQARGGGRAAGQPAPTSAAELTAACAPR